MSELLQQFTVELFRELVDVRLPELGRANLIQGESNSGKTSVLEALRIFARPFASRSWVDIARGRDAHSRQTIARNIEWLFPHPSGEVENFEGSLSLSAVRSERAERIEASCKRIERLTEHTETIFDEETETAQDVRFEEVQSGLCIDVQRTAGPEIVRNAFTLWEGDWFPVSLFQDKEHIPARLVTPASHVTDVLPSHSLTQAALDSIRAGVAEFDPSVRALEFTGPRIYLERNGSGRMPVSTFGSTIRRILLIAAAIPMVAGGMLLIDEIEAGLDADLLPRFVSWLLRSCGDWRVQLFATTHSPAAAALWPATFPAFQLR